LNPYAWNQRSNIVYIESPTGVGFSYSTLPKDYKSSDNSTAMDNYNLIQQFFDIFPEYSTNSMYLTSESYGGHYIPILAKLVVLENKSPSPNRRVLNLKGIAIGNPYTDVYSGKPAMIETMWGHQLISSPLYNYYRAECELAPDSSKCANLEDEALKIGNINPYGLDFDFCNPPILSRRLIEAAGQSTALSQNVKRTVQQLWLLNHMYKHLSSSERSQLSLPSTAEFEPCEEDWTTHYLNTAKVKKAIHVRDNITWSHCSKYVVPIFLIIAFLFQNFLFFS
jgi:serine carboxypeptidase-like clade II